MAGNTATHKRGKAKGRQGGMQGKERSYSKNRKSAAGKQSMKRTSSTFAKAPENICGVEQEH